MQVEPIGPFFGDFQIKPGLPLAKLEYPASAPAPADGSGLETNSQSPLAVPAVTGA